MTWIRTVAEDDATGELREYYDSVRGNTGFISEMLKVASIKPRAALALQHFRENVLFGASGLGRVREEMIAVVVSGINRCSY